MSIRFKIFLILGISQILLLVALTLTFGILIVNVKNEPQNQRAIELARNFQRELSHKEDKLKLLITELKKNPSTLSILQKGINNRSVFNSNLPYLKEIMTRYDLSIFELGDKKGKVQFRVHRPSDFGDDKSNQPLIQKALSGGTISSLETGHSGLGFRVAGALENYGTILIGQVVDSKFLEDISGKESVHLSVFEKNNHLISSSQLMENFWKSKNPDEFTKNVRLTWENTPFYFVYDKMDSTKVSSLDLNFRILIDEKELDQASQKIWTIFALIAMLVFAAIFFVSFLFSRDIVEAVKKLNQAMKNIDLAKVDDLPINRKDEIGQMGVVFQEMKKDLYQHQNKLEEMVATKTKELHDTLDEVNTIKEQQDGDYFLTSLLIKPLTGNKSITKNYSIEIVERQKKHFMFRNRRSEIGGDLSVVQEINLKGKNYIVFMNADAMGKSIQGAGGALVMGTVFKSVVTRTQQIPSMQNRHPERWLKDCFMELQDVFVSFDGSMLLSAVIGLIDEATGTMYFLNAEHPWVVLYRDEKASFIENELLLRKIGFTDSEISMNHFTIKVFQFDVGDTIFIGSDGRDDILMGEDLSGKRIINEDETEFLRSVESGGGDIQLVENAILSKGDLTDDFSLIRIKYLSNLESNSTSDDSHLDGYSDQIKEGIEYFKDGKLIDAIHSFERILKEKPEHPHILRELAKLYIKTKEYEKAVEHAEKYSRLRPFDSDFLYYIAFAYKKSEKYESALDFSERLRLRNPKHLKNLVLLAECYISLDNYKKAESTINYLLEIDSRHPRGIQMASFIQEKRTTEFIK